MSHENEYHDSMVQLLELLWGAGYMAPGGPGNVARLLDGTQPAGKRILDIGCGIGGPAREMAAAHGAEVVGIDLEQPLIDKAIADTAAAGLDENVRFERVEAGPLPFPGDEFDIVVSSGAMTQTPDKPAMFAEVLRVLRPGGHFRCYEWFRSAADYSGDMHYWFELEGLTYEMVTLEQFAALLREAGFTDVEVMDASGWYRAESQCEYELIRGDLYATVVDKLGQADADHFVENWRMLARVCEAGELLQGYSRGRAPERG
ncbi:MAG: methyltransferase domain-containing protein [Woeseiaceae bacterium]|nr:methyltransferase domain-containing protein [Woeseiaceae bacterium]